MPPALGDVLEWAQGRVEGLLEEAGVRDGEGGGGNDAWYWAAPILLDLHFDKEATIEWLRDPELVTVWSGEDREASSNEEDSTHWSEHVEEARKLVDGPAGLGPPPADLAAVLALKALSGWGTVALRALRRVAGGEGSGEARGAAARVAWSLRSLFNTPEATTLVRERRRRTPYWRNVLEYGAAGGLQAVLDEYAHALRESEGLLDEPPGEVATEVARAICEALRIRTSNLGVDEVIVDMSSPEIRLERHRMRGHYALRFGEERSEDGTEITRAGQVSEAMLEEADLVLAMSPRHVRALHRSFGGLSDKVYTLPQYTIDISSEERIPDPYGHTMTTFRASVRQLLSYTEKVVERLEREKALR